MSESESKQFPTFTDEQFVDLYLAIFHLAWMKNYKLGWIYHRLVEELGEEQTRKFLGSAEEKKMPLVSVVPMAHITTSAFLVSVNKKFSDWVFDKMPSSEMFCARVKQARQHLLHTEAKMRVAGKAQTAALNERKWHALDSFGGEVKELKPQALHYLGAGRTTGKAMSEKTFAK